MKHITDGINVDDLATAREEKHTQNTLNPLSIKLVNYVFAKFYTCCRGTDTIFADEKRKLAETTQWYAMFTKLALTTVGQIQKAIDRLERHSYPNPPQLGEFLKWNEPSFEDFGLLTKEQAFNRSSELMREGELKDLSETQNKILKHVIRESDSFFLKNNPMSKTQPVFYRNYDIAIRDFMAGNLKDIPKAIPDKRAEWDDIDKKKIIAKDFDHLRGYEENMPEIRLILEVNLNGTTTDK